MGAVGFAPHRNKVVLGRMSSPLLDISRLLLRFGGVTALSDVSFSVADGALSAIIGPNGAGKTSLLNCISGVYRPQQGRVVFDGNDVTRMGPATPGTPGAPGAEQQPGATPPGPPPEPPK